MTLGEDDGDEKSGEPDASASGDELAAGPPAGPSTEPNFLERGRSTFQQAWSKATPKRLIAAAAVFLLAVVVLGDPVLDRLASRRLESATRCLEADDMTVQFSRWPRLARLAIGDIAPIRVEASRMEVSGLTLRNLVIDLSDVSAPPLALMLGQNDVEIKKGRATALLLERDLNDFLSRDGSLDVEARYRDNGAIDIRIDLPVIADIEFSMTVETTRNGLLLRFPPAQLDGIAGFLDGAIDDLLDRGFEVPMPEGIDVTEFEVSQGQISFVTDMGGGVGFGGLGCVD